MNRAVEHLQNIGVRDYYRTPKELFDEACQKYGLDIIYDVACNSENKVCSIGITEEQNSLSFNWDRDFFMNPPYSQVKKFMQKAYTEHLKHNVNALILVYAKTDTQFWHDYVENKAEVHFIKGRIKFLDEHGNKTKYPAPYGSCWIIYRRKI